MADSDLKLHPLQIEHLKRAAAAPKDMEVIAPIKGIRTLNPPTPQGRPVLSCICPKCNAHFGVSGHEDCDSKCFMCSQMCRITAVDPPDLTNL